MDLYYEVHGEGTPLVLLHSGGEDFRDWHAIAPQLSQTNKVVTFDGRGVGRSPAVLEPINYIEDFRAFLDFLGIETAVLVGQLDGRSSRYRFCFNLSRAGVPVGLDLSRSYWFSVLSRI